MILRRMRAKIGRRLYTAVSVSALLIVAVGWALYTGFAVDIGLALLYRLPSGGLGVAPPVYDGPASLEERILEADVIARVRLLSMSPVVETFYSQGFEDDGEWIEDTAYGSALEFRFEVIEYLKGEGGGEIVGIVYGQDYYESRVGGFAFGADLTETHDTTWDDREAVVFMNRRQSIVSTTEQPDRYVLGFADYGDFDSDSYTIESIHAKRWLPSAFSSGDINAVASHASAGGGNEDELRFLTGAKRAEGESRTEIIDYRVANSAHNEALGTGGDSSTISFSHLKNLIAELQEEIDEGDGSEEYRECVLYKYSRNREVEYHYHASGGATYDTISYDHKLASGSPANTVFALGTSPFQITDPFVPSDIYVTDIEGVTWLEGKDAHLFHTVDNKLLIGNVRPLSEGQYRFYLNGLESKFIPCNAYPDRLRTSNELVANVIAPEGTLHEAFFDPADLDDTVGADGESGVLQPEWFETEEGETVIERIGWSEGQVEIELSPVTYLDDHRMDFIALDGSVALRLDFAAADTLADDEDVATFAWGVCEQPWTDGDLLMLRIAEGIPDDGVASTNDPECLAALPEQILVPAAVSTPEPTPEPTATLEPTPTPTP